MVELGGTEFREKEHRQLVTKFNVISSEKIEIEDEDNFENLKQLINKKLKSLKTLPECISFIGDTLLLRIRRAIAEQRIDHNDVRFYYVNRNKDGSSTSKAIELNDRGTPSWWPRGIFAEDQEEYQAIRRALSQR